ncbi:unnamed protein product, partial [Didymodactylos carnosus]
RCSTENEIISDALIYQYKTLEYQIYSDYKQISLNDLFTFKSKLSLNNWLYYSVSQLICTVAADSSVDSDNNHYHTAVIECALQCVEHLRKTYLQSPDAPTNEYYSIFLADKYEQLADFLPSRDSQKISNYKEAIKIRKICQVVEHVNKAPFLSVTIDSTPDCTNHEMYSVFVRYVEDFENRF